MKSLLLFSLYVTLAASSARAQQIISEKNTPGSVGLVLGNAVASIYADDADFETVNKTASLFQQDIEMVTGKKPAIINKLSGQEKNIIIIGTIGKSALIGQLVKEKKLDVSGITGKWEAYQIQTIAHPFKAVENALVVTGSDSRGVAYGVFELSKQIGVSPWYWWADVPVKKKTSLYVKQSKAISDAPKVKYRGIFINDEAPALSGWSKEKFGGFNSKFYAKVFELILRLKGNYLWPAMWGNAFYDDDSLNIKAANEYGIVIGTSHHEPLMRAHDEWRRYGRGAWDYDSNEVRLKEFWKQGMQRATNEKIVSVGMRGDGDKPMSRETATSLLERIVKDQRQIIEEVTHKPASATPQLWALYKEVQDYYDKGMRVPDDVTLLLCDDNWGNLRKLPALNAAPRKGGYGIYYHFDYVGDPRNYKWLNTNPIPRVWEQMHLAYEHNVKDIWIVNVGDIKPMEFPISFWLDYAWNPERIDAADLKEYTENWCADQFGAAHAVEIADILSKYAKYNGRRKPELLNENTYSINYGEIAIVTQEYDNLLAKAEKINDLLSAEFKDAFFELILHPVKACANLQELYETVTFNHMGASKNSTGANIMADKAKHLYENDSLITLQYHTIANGKWNHMMSQTHIGYTYWQQPNVQKMPEVKYIAIDTTVEKTKTVMVQDVKLESIVAHSGPEDKNINIFHETDGYVSIEAADFTKAINTGNIKWKVLPDLGRTGSAVTSFPVTSSNQKPGAHSPQLQYEFYSYDSGSIKLQAYFSPSLNFNNDEGLKYAVSIDNEPPQIVVLNKEDNQQKIWARWVADNIIIKTTDHIISQPGKHVLHYWMVTPAVVLQKLVFDLGGLKESYLGPPETRH
jgi:Glycosyl hydrolase family 115/Gylcosyl hydrolase family 115 C-terminal domain